MPILSPSNIKRAYYYLRRNGLVNTYYAAKEEIEDNEKRFYNYQAPSKEDLEKQTAFCKKYEDSPFPVFDIVVPTFCTPKDFFYQLLDSCMEQTWGYFHLILADSTPDSSVEDALTAYKNQNASKYSESEIARIIFHKLSENQGISGNTNEGIRIAKGDYICFLDHDDLLTPDALYEMAYAILTSKERPLIIYSDEDKCDGEVSSFYDPNRKPDFNPDYLFSNNYICHFTAMERSLAQKLELRPAYDGAQDYDLMLRGFMASSWKNGKSPLYGEQVIYHIPKVLYHWRCHQASTAQNPHSKDYAYNAGLRAVQDLADSMGWRAKAKELRHVGFYSLDFEGDIFRSRQELGAVGGRILQNNRSGQVIGGAMSADGALLYGNMPAAYGGYLHRASLTSDVEALDIRCIRVNPSQRYLFEEITGVPYKEIPLPNKRYLGPVNQKNNISKNEFDMIFDASTLPNNTDYIALSKKFSQELRKRGFLLLYRPEWEVIHRKRG